jgi:hypothetical protein
MIFVLWSFLKALSSSTFLPESHIFTIILQEAVSKFSFFSFFLTNIFQCQFGVFCVQIYSQA